MKKLILIPLFMLALIGCVTDDAEPAPPPGGQPECVRIGRVVVVNVVSERHEIEPERIKVVKAVWDSAIASRPLADDPEAYWGAVRSGVEDHVGDAEMAAMVVASFREGFESAIDSRSLADDPEIDWGSVRSMIEDQVGDTETAEVVVASFREGFKSAATSDYHSCLLSFLYGVEEALEDYEEVFP